MSDACKSRKIINSIGVGIMTALSSAAIVQPASAAGLEEVQNVSAIQENESVAVSRNQDVITAIGDFFDRVIAFFRK